MSGKIFLLIDDDADDRALFGEALQEIDPALICYTAASGPAALIQLASGEIEMPHIIFLDLNMPKVNGWKCLSLLSEEEKFKKIPVILYSTASPVEETYHLEGPNLLCFYTKPPDYQCLKKDLTWVVKYLLSDTLPLLRHQAPFTFTSNEGNPQA
jgi:CheY-like chemotaxis protein